MIQLENVAFGYKMTKKLFHDLSLSLDSGAIVGLLGKNGEGKSTLLKLLAGQLLNQSGEIRVDGDNPKQREASFLQKVFLLPEEVLVPKLTIAQYFSIITPFYPNYSAEIAEELLQEFDIHWDMNLHKVSQGQKKKAVIALALSLRVPYLFMDEPTNGLDIPSKSAFRRIVARYTSEEQTLIISTHQVRDLDQLIDHIVLMEQNKIVCNASIADLSEKFLFQKVTDGEEENLLYKESSLLGEYGVFENKYKEEETDFSIELFFNAEVSNPEKMQVLLGQIKNEEVGTQNK